MWRPSKGSSTPLAAAAAAADATEALSTASKNTISNESEVERPLGSICSAQLHWKQTAFARENARAKQKAVEEAFLKCFGSLNVSHSASSSAAVRWKAPTIASGNAREPLHAAHLEAADKSSAARVRLVEFYTLHNPSKLETVDETLKKYEGRHEELFASLEKKYKQYPPAEGSGPSCYLDIEIDGNRAGRIEVRLFADKVPKTAENFRLLCVGSAGNSSRCWGKKREYKNTKFHRVIPGFMAQGGDFFRGDGTGGESAYAGTPEADLNGKFADESYKMAHDKRGLLSMANSGKDTNGSQFFITFAKAKHLDGKHVVFGRVTSGLHVLDQIEKVQISAESNRPNVPIVIADCGQVEDKKVPSVSNATTTVDVAVIKEVERMRRQLRIDSTLTEVAESWARSANAAGAACTAASAARERNHQFLAIAFEHSNSTHLRNQSDALVTTDKKGSTSNETTIEAHADTQVVDSNATRAEEAFDARDEDSDGIITMDEFENVLDDLGEGFYGEEMEKQRKLVDPEATGKLTKENFVDFFVKLVTGAASDEDDDDDEEELEEERENARQAFDAVDSGNTGVIDRAKFQELIESLGTTYCEEEHRRTLKKLCTSAGRISRSDFVEWYAQWVTGEGDDEDDDDDGDAEEVDEATLAARWGKLSAPKEGTWKCSVCSVYNDAALQKCAACETPNPSAAPVDQKSALSTLKPASGGAIGGGGFSFGGSSSSSTAATFSFSQTSAAPSPAPGFHFGASAATNSSTPALSTGAGNPLSSSGGFTFGKTSSVGNSEKSNAAPPTFSFGLGASTTNEPPQAASNALASDGSAAPAASNEAFGSSASKEVSNKADTERDDDEDPRRDANAIRAEEAFDACDADGDGVVKMDLFEAILDDLGEGFYGEEMEKQRNLVDPEATGKLKKAIFIDFFTKLVSDNNDDNGDEEEELEEERENARQAFDAVDSRKAGVIDRAKFQELIESLGTTYCEEEHRRTLKKLCTSAGQISRSDFVEWYAQWVTGDDDDEDDDDGEAEEVDEATLAARWGKLSAPKEGTWKCAVCSVYNDEALQKCAACETPNPSAPVDQKSAASNSTPASVGTIGGSGFSFGALRSSTDGFPKDKNSLFKIGSSGFSFSAQDTKSPKFAFGASESHAQGSLPWTGTSAAVTPSNSASLGTLPNLKSNEVVEKSSGTQSSPSIVDSGSSKSKFLQHNDGEAARFNSPGVDLSEPHTGAKQVNLASDAFEGRVPLDSSSFGLDSKRKIAKRAMDAFDAQDKRGNALDEILSMDDFDSVMAHLGENLSKDKLDKQRKLVDPKGTGMLTRESFITYYVEFVTKAASDDDDDDYETVDDDELDDEDGSSDEEPSESGRNDSVSNTAVSLTKGGLDKPATVSTFEPKHVPTMEAGATIQRTNQSFLGTGANTEATARTASSADTQFSFGIPSKPQSTTAEESKRPKFSFGMPAGKSATASDRDVFPPFGVREPTELSSKAFSFGSVDPTRRNAVDVQKPTGFTFGTGASYKDDELAPSSFSFSNAGAEHSKSEKGFSFGLTEK